MSHISREKLLADYPDTPSISAEDVAAAQKSSSSHPIYVVLDDDPTGTQSVAALPVLTSWEIHDFDWAFSTKAPAVYVMTNSRSLDPDAAERVNREVVTAALTSARQAGVTVAFVSRSDSTLRGHYPLEPDVISDVLKSETGQEIDGVVIVPAFGDAGRITVGGIHYAGNAAEGYLPVGQTEFAKDATFGYHSSSLSQWVEEKTAGRYKAQDVLTIHLDQLRSNPQEALAVLNSAGGRVPIVVDIVEEEDLRQLSLLLIEAEAQGKRFVYRVGPPFVRARVGQDVHSPLTPQEIHASRGEREVKAGGLIVVGSHVGLTTRQLDALRERRAPVELEIDVAKVVDPDVRSAHLAELIEEAVSQIEVGNVVVRTSRKLVTGSSPEESLAISRNISSAVVEVVQGIIARTSPRFVIAKGGITSSDVASLGLGIRHAIVVGPMLPGIVSLWSGQDGPARGIPYIVFAGNVGSDESLADVVDKLAR